MISAFMGRDRSHFNLSLNLVSVGVEAKGRCENSRVVRSVNEKICSNYKEDLP
jgi:hypothetical protein